MAEHFGLDERVTRLLDEEMKKRRKTFEEDLQAQQGQTSARKFYTIFGWGIDRCEDSQGCSRAGIPHVVL